MASVVSFICLLCLELGRLAADRRVVCVTARPPYCTGGVRIFRARNFAMTRVRSFDPRKAASQRQAEAEEEEAAAAAAGQGKQRREGRRDGFRDDKGQGFEQGRQGRRGRLGDEGQGREEEAGQGRQVD